MLLWNDKCFTCRVWRVSLVSCTQPQMQSLGALKTQTVDQILESFVPLQVQMEAATCASPWHPQHALSQPQTQSTPPPQQLLDVDFWWHRPSTLLWWKQFVWSFCNHFLPFALLFLSWYLERNYSFLCLYLICVLWNEHWGISERLLTKPISRWCYNFDNVRLYEATSCLEKLLVSW